MKKEQIVIGTPVTYYGVIKDNGTKLDPFKTEITSEPWLVGDLYVCTVKGKSGAVAIKHLELLTPENKPKLAIDVHSLSNIKMGGQYVPAIDIIKIFDERGLLFYNSEYGEKPMLIEGEVKLIDWNTPEGKEYLEKIKPQE